jgi:hypothetical protein
MPIFRERAALKVYLEASDYGRVVEAAKGAGKLVSEWAREILLREASGGTQASENVLRMGRGVDDPVRGDRRGRARTPGRFRDAEDAAHSVGRKTGRVAHDGDSGSGMICKHGARRDLCRYDECRRSCNR